MHVSEMGDYSNHVTPISKIEAFSFFGWKLFFYKVDSLMTKQGWLILVFVIVSALPKDRHIIDISMP